MLNRIATVLVTSLFLITACTAPGSSVSPPGASSSAGPSTGPTPASAMPSGTGTASPAPSASTSPGPTPSSSPLAGFACGLPVTGAGTASGPNQAQPSVVRLGTHPGYDRIVFEYLGTTMPAVRIEQVDRPFTHDPSGLPLLVKGDSFVRIGSKASRRPIPARWPSSSPARRSSRWPRKATTRGSSRGSSVSTSPPACGSLS